MHNLFGCKITKHCKIGGGKALNKIKDSFLAYFQPPVWQIFTIVSTHSRLLAGVFSCRCCPGEAWLVLCCLPKTKTLNVITLIGASLDKTLCYFVSGSSITVRSFDSHVLSKLSANIWCDMPMLRNERKLKRPSWIVLLASLIRWANCNLNYFGVFVPRSAIFCIAMSLFGTSCAELCTDKQSNSQTIW